MFCKNIIVCSLVNKLNLRLLRLDIICNQFPISKAFSLPLPTLRFSNTSAPYPFPPASPPMVYITRTCYAYTCRRIYYTITPIAACGTDIDLSPIIPRYVMHSMSVDDT